MASLPETRRSTYGPGPHTTDHDIIHDVLNIIIEQGVPGQVLAKTNSINPQSHSGAHIGFISVPNASDFLAVAGGTMLGSLSMGNSRITALAVPVSSTDAANRQYVDESINNTVSGMAKYVTATSPTVERPAWSGTVVWTVLYSPFSYPLNSINGDHIIDASEV